ncbi:hypothetical protein AABB24_013820 [Solanum stoloniferum]|uniref:Uncharacterized protein n=1 Tax=Solanum stoloniferum TaxID=62892 RepID=A0ABD2TWY9_9SOLN
MLATNIFFNHNFLLQEQLKIVGNSTPTLMGLKELADSLPEVNSNRFITDGITQDGIDKLKPPRPLLRYCFFSSRILFASFNAASPHSLFSFYYDHYEGFELIV